LSARGDGPTLPARAIAAAGEALWRAWDAHVLLDAFPGAGLPPGVADGYAIQDAMLRASGLAPVGWKIGATNEAAQRMLSLDGPVSGRLLAPFCFDTPATLPTEDFAIRALEPEIAFRLATDLPPRAVPYDEREVAAAVGSAHPALEVPDTRLRHWDSVGAPGFVADNSAAGRFVLGPAVEDWRERDLAALTARLLINGETAAEGRGADALGGPLLALAWLANHLPSRGAQLRAGELVTTGTRTPIRRAEAGDHVVAEFADFGNASARFA
jgi:2-keto-4-pentenoate hydratase